MSNSKKSNTFNHQTTISLYDNEGRRKYLNSEERIHFYKQIHSINIEKRLFLKMLFWTGARISEVLNLEVKDIDFTDKVASIHCLKKRKKGIYRHIPIPEELLKELGNYIKQNNIKDDIWKYSRRTATRYVKAVMQACDIYGSRSCSRGLRHSFAVHCVFNNIPLHTVQKWMGHSSIITTTIYLNIVGKEERELAERIWL